MSSDLDDAEREKLEARYSEIATLAGGLAHEIRNPLSTISMNLELLSEDIEQDDDSPRSRRMLTKIRTVRDECQHLEDILNAFLQFARAGELELIRGSLNDLLTDFIQFYQPTAADAGIEISPHLASDLPPVMMDHQLMRQVLMNLVQNSIQAMPDGGLLEFQTRENNGRVEFGLIDTGAGMEERTRSRMFQAFYSTRSGGSGLGLPTVQKIIEAHHGTIQCESEPGRGTRFTISLPPAEPSE